MSVASHRDLIVEALEPVDVVDAHPRFTATDAPGTAYPRMVAIRYPNKFGGVVEWSVVVVLPQDIDTAEQWIEDHLDELHAALSRPSGPLVVTSIEPRRLETGAGVLPSLFINGHRAEQD